MIMTILELFGSNRIWRYFGIATHPVNDKRFNSAHTERERERERERAGIKRVLFHHWLLSALAPKTSVNTWHILAICMREVKAQL